MCIPNPMKVVIALCVIVLTGLGFYCADWQKKMATTQMLAHTSAEKAEELEAYTKMAMELPAEKKRNEQLARELAGIIKTQLAPEKGADFVPAYMADIEKLVENVKMKMGDQNFLITVLNPGAASKEAGDGYLSDYPRKSFQLQLSGRYGTVVDFLRQLGELKLRRLVTIDRLSLSPSAEARGGQSPTLSVAMPMTAYLQPGQ